MRIRNGRSSVATSTALRAASVLPASTHNTDALSSQSLTLSPMTSPGLSPVRTIVAAASASGSPRRSASATSFLASSIRSWFAPTLPTFDGRRRRHLFHETLVPTVSEKSPQRAGDPVLAVDRLQYHVLVPGLRPRERFDRHRAPSLEHRFETESHCPNARRRGDRLDHDPPGRLRDDPDLEGGRRQGEGRARAQLAHPRHGALAAHWPRARRPMLRIRGRGRRNTRNCGCTLCICKEPFLSLHLVSWLGAARPPRRDPTGAMPGAVMRSAVTQASPVRPAVTRATAVAPVVIPTPVRPAAMRATAARPAVTGERTVVMRAAVASVVTRAAGGPVVTRAGAAPIARTRRPTGKGAQRLRRSAASCAAPTTRTRRRSACRAHGFALAASLASAHVRLVRAFCRSVARAACPVGSSLASATQAPTDRAARTRWPVEQPLSLDKVPLVPWVLICEQCSRTLSQ